MSSPEKETAQRLERASQTLARAIDVLDALRRGPLDLKTLQERVGLTRSTAHRLAKLLAERNLISLESRRYRLGPALLYLGARARERRDLISVSLPFIDALAAETDDAVNLAIRDGDEIIYIAQAPSRRRVAVRHRVGDRNTVGATALGRALMLDADAATQLRLFQNQTPSSVAPHGCVLHLESQGDEIRCVAAPIRDASGTIVAALSLSSIPQYMDSDRLEIFAPASGPGPSNGRRSDEGQRECGHAIGDGGPRPPSSTRIERHQVRRTESRFAASR
jgi:DNA-binding IclR family transcriptional regulator